MGVGGNFWDFLKPCAGFEGFGFLRDKRVAVDLSYWIVQNETAIKGCYRNSHIRQTFFRTVNLFSKFGAYPVFVLDGTPSPLKSRARILRFFRSSGIDVSEMPDVEDGVSVERNRAFKKYVEDCVVLLELLGMPVLKAIGEAEALCAELNREGYVDACITADSDAFLYGAQCVIKMILPKSKAPFECYHISDIEMFLGLKRKHLIAVSLLVGNDHDLNGVRGIGMETAVRFVKSFDEEQIFDCLHNIANEDAVVSHENLRGIAEDSCSSHDQSPKQKTPHCSHCGHPGKKKAHLKFSCEYCKTISGESCLPKSVGFRCCCSSCDLEMIDKEKRKNATWRRSVCEKIASHPKFPNVEILQMYLKKHHGTDDEPCIGWASPSTEMLVDYLAFQQQWTPSYIRQKLLPMLSTIYLRSMATNSTNDLLLCGQYEFDRIHRVKTTYGHNVFVIKWKKVVPAFSSAVVVISEDSDLHKESEKNAEDSDNFEQLDSPYIYSENGCYFLLTEEDMELVQKAFPEKAREFQKETELKEMKSSKQKSKLKATPESLKIPRSQSVQSKLTQFYSSSKALTQKKNEASLQASDGSSQTKRKTSSPGIPKSVRRRLLFG